MNLVLTYCWKEWRSQRDVLVAYTLLGLASLCLVFLMVPEAWWLEHGKRALALSWFFAIGVIGVIAFVAPALVRNEFGAKNDQFVRRLPGALRPSFGGKLLFLVLVAAALPLACLLAGEWFLLAIGQPWDDLFLWEHNGTVSLQWPWPVLVVAEAALLTTWVWAIGTWLPNGRMALGGTILFVLLLGLGVFAVLRQSPGLEKGIAWESWLWTVPVLGLAVAGVSWTRGRRGGGPLRSARYGLCATALGLLPPSLWLADRVHDYHHPDLQRLSELYVQGTSPDGRYLLAGGAENPNFAKVPIRIDLQDGSATQVGSMLTSFGSQLVKPYSTWHVCNSRYWVQSLVDSVTGGNVAHEVFDLAIGTSTPIAWDDKAHTAVLPPSLAATVMAEVRNSTPLRAPGGRRAWFQGGDVCTESADGVVTRIPWRGPSPEWLRARGHGFFDAASRQQFDLVNLKQTEGKGIEYGWFVNGCCVFKKGVVPANRWWRQDGDQVPTPIAELEGCGVHGLFDDERLLCSTRRKQQTQSLFLFRVSDGQRTELSLPADAPVGAVVQTAWLLAPESSLLPRDPAGHIWLQATNRTKVQFLRLDPATLAISTVPEGPLRTLNGPLLGWPDAQSAIVQENAAIWHIDVATGAIRRLFPRP